MTTNTIILTSFTHCIPTASTPMPSSAYASSSRKFAIDRAALGDMGDKHSARLLVDRIFTAVLEGVRTRRLAHGDKLPSLRVVAESAQVSRDTVARAYEKLVAHGHVYTRPGAGFFIRVDNQVANAQTPAVPAPLLTNWRQRLLDPRTLLHRGLGSGDLPPDWLNVPQLAATLRAVSRSNINWAAGYGDAQGYLPLRQQLQRKLADIGIDVTPRQVLTTLGATDAINLIVMSYLRQPGMTVLVDDPGSFLLMDRLLASGMHIIGVTRDADGPDITALQNACEQHGPAFYFCQSLLHSPGYTGLSPQRAFQILRLAERFNFTIVEDDTYGDLAPVHRPPHATRLASLDQLQHVLYVGSFSKTLGAGMRVGFIAGNPQQIEWLLLYKLVSRASNGSLAERMIYRLLSEGGYRRHCEQLRARLDQARPRLMAALEALGIVLQHRPDAGLYLWGRLPGDLNAMEVAERMLANGYLTAPGPVFSSGEAARSHMRFNVASSDDDALRALSSVLERSASG
ncbi:PLP-dependent aminotransferase family protein [Herbaspirillum rubrisubalbicans]|nr:PLP-dependent aminotransferase family protein [Herbaspirillum rubrisubalbicans]